MAIVDSGVANALPASLKANASLAASFGHAGIVKPATGKCFSRSTAWEEPPPNAARPGANVAHRSGTIASRCSPASNHTKLRLSWDRSANNE